MMLEELISRPLGSHADMIRWHAAQRPAHLAIICDDCEVDYAELDRRVNGVAARLQQEKLGPGDIAAMCANTGVNYLVAILGCVRAGVAFAPLAPSATPEHRNAMLQNAEAKMLFLDAEAARDWRLPAGSVAPCVSLDDSDAGFPWTQWLPPGAGARPEPVAVEAETPFNLIYSSGTTGVPKGILQPWRMRWSQVLRARQVGYGPESVMLAATPLYSNTTLVSVLPTLALGGTVILMRKFDVRNYLELAQRHRATHTMLVPVQYQRLLDAPDFDEYDLSSLRNRFSAGAPFAAELKAEVLRRWPGALVEYYGMTEGGGRCELEAHLHPDKLHTVGRPPAGNDIRLIDEAGREVPPGATGEIVGHSAAMMTGYHRNPEKTREAEWFDAQGKRFIRTGDVGRFDEDGFLILGDRKKDMIISGGFNIYPSDLEAELNQHPSVAESAVVGVPSRAWGETPVAFAVLRPASSAPDADELKQWLNKRVGKTQRVADLHILEQLPRNDLGKVLKRELIQRYARLHSAQDPQ
jgi:acyl-CoA synthetase (AMP-forming)/AMP-acid ligase II